MIRNSIVKIISLLLIIGLNWFGLSAIAQTLAGFNDTETSAGNVLAAGILDFSLTNTNIEEFIGVELGEDIELISVATKTTGSLGIQYKVYAEKISGNDEFCEALQLEAFHSAVFYDGDLLSFSTPTTTDLGTWAFEIKLPHTASNFAHGEECNVDLVFQGWRDDVPDFDQSGFTDEERIHLRLTSRMIVLNEFLPNPDPSANGFDFGNDSDPMPKGEWVELYNNSDYDFDVAGWYLTDADGHRIDIESCRTNTENTIIPAKGFLVVYKNGGEECGSHNFSLNNNGDTVKLFNNEGVLIDFYSYDAHNYCQLEPTPGGENSDTTGNGNCEEVPPNKSYARIPDGIGVWVDPIPTPGAPNVLESEMEEITESAISQVEDLTEESILNQENNSPQVEIENENITGDGNTTGNENVINSEPEGLEEQDVFDKENEESFGENKGVETDDGKDIEQLQETTEEAVEEVIEENFEISQEDEELDGSVEMDINEEGMNEECSVSDGSVVEEENTAGDGAEIEEDADDENTTDEIIEEETEEIDAEIDSASEQEEIDEASEEEIDEASESDAEEDVTDGEESEIATEEDSEETEEGFISDQSVNDISLDKNLTEGSEEVADEDSSSNSSDIQEIEEQTGSLPNNAFISGASDESDGGDSSDSDNSDSGGIDEGNES